MGECNARGNAFRSFGTIWGEDVWCIITQPQSQLLTRNADKVPLLQVAPHYVGSCYSKTIFFLTKSLSVYWAWHPTACGSHYATTTHKGYCLQVRLRHHFCSQLKFALSSAKFIIICPAVYSLCGLRLLSPQHPHFISSSPSSLTMFRSALRQSTRSAGVFSAGRIVAVCFF